MGKGGRPQDLFQAHRALRHWKSIARTGRDRRTINSTHIRASHRQNFHTRCNLKRSGAPTSWPSPNQRLYMFKGSSTLQDISRSQEACKKGVISLLEPRRRLTTPAGTTAEGTQPHVLQQSQFVAPDARTPALFLQQMSRNHQIHHLRERSVPCFPNSTTQRESSRASESKSKDLCGMREKLSVSSKQVITTRR